MRISTVIACLIMIFSSSAFAQNAKAYCWETKYGKYGCYGPVQKTSSSWDTMEEAQDISGCKGAGNQRGILGRGKGRGVWFTCYNHSLESYDNSPNKIQKWVRNQ